MVWPALRFQRVKQVLAVPESVSPESTKGPTLTSLQHWPQAFCLLLSSLAVESQLNLGAGRVAKRLPASSYNSF